MSTQQGFYVPGGKNRFEEELMIWGVIPLQIKGEFAFEVGAERFTLRPGDSLFVARMVSHVWVYIGDDPGTLLVAIQPAGSFEAFFRESCEMNRLPTPEEEDRMHAAHGMKILGPPLDAA